MHEKPTKLTTCQILRMGYLTTCEICLWWLYLLFYFGEDDFFFGKADWCICLLRRICECYYRWAFNWAHVIVSAHRYVTLKWLWCLAEKYTCKLRCDYSTVYKHSRCCGILIKMVYNKKTLKRSKRRQLHKQHFAFIIQASFHWWEFDRTL